MIKNLLTAVLLLSSVAAFPQWTKTLIKGDELFGTSDDVAWTFKDPRTSHSFTFWGSSPNHFSITSATDIFSYTYEKGYCGIIVTVGLYDDEGYLRDKFNMWLDVNAEGGNLKTARTRVASKMSTPIGQSKKAKKIIKHLSTKGYIRIFTNLYGNSTFDLSVPNY